MTGLSAFVTLLTDESYLPGALTLGQTLKEEYGTKHALGVLLKTSNFSENSLGLIKEVYDDIIPIDDKEISAPIEKLAKKLGRSELSVTFSKILLWDQVKYDSILYLDSDTLPLKSLDSVFEAYSDIKGHQVVASPDSGWPDIFNSGVVLLKPDSKVFEELLDHSSKPNATFDGADQGLLNEYFNIGSAGLNWIRLPFIFNVTPTPSYQYVPAYQRFFNDIHLLHFIGALKPWTSFSYDSSDYSSLWWDAFNKYYFDPVKRSTLLSFRRSGAENLAFDKIQNTWDKEDPQQAHYTEEPPTEEPSVPVFPWEEREKVQPTRIFNPATLPNPDNGTFDQNLAETSEAISSLNISNARLAAQSSIEKSRKKKSTASPQDSESSSGTRTPDKGEKSSRFFNFLGRKS